MARPRSSILKSNNQNIGKLISSFHTMEWSLTKLAHYLVHWRSFFFILDSSFAFYKDYYISVDFIIETFTKMRENERFAIEVLGQPNLTLPLEEKSKNKHLKTKFFNQLSDSVCKPSYQAGNRLEFKLNL